MPQPFNKVVPDAHVYIDSGALSDKPDMAVLVARIFAVWAQIEHELSFLLVRVLGAEAAPAIAMHATLTAQHLQNSALQAAAKAALLPDQFDIFQAALSTAESASTPRNHLAHWIWGGCKQRPELLALFDPKMVKARDFRVEKFYSQNPHRGPDDIIKNIELHYFDTSNVLAYSKTDLERALRDIIESFQTLVLLGIYLNPVSAASLAKFTEFEASPQEIVTELLEKLNGLRLFREALDRIRAGRNNRPTKTGG
jgi:hypothetical protein